MADGLFLGLQHSARATRRSRSRTSRSRSTGTRTPTGRGSPRRPRRPARSTRRSTVPEDTPYGMYDGAIVLTNGDDSMVVPVDRRGRRDGRSRTPTATSPARSSSAAPTSPRRRRTCSTTTARCSGPTTGPGGPSPVTGGSSSSTCPEEPADGSLFLARTDVGGRRAVHRHRHADHGPVREPLPGAAATPSFGGPYIIDTVGGSPNTQHRRRRLAVRHGHRRRRRTSSPRRPRRACTRSSLHQVSWQGDDFDTPFEVTLGSASVAPSSVDIDTTADTGELRRHLRVQRRPRRACGRGLRPQPAERDRPRVGQQDDPNDPSSASIKKDVTIDHASRLTRRDDAGDRRPRPVRRLRREQRRQLHQRRDRRGVGDRRRRTSSSSSSRPPDGNYQVWVQGWAVAGTPTFELTIDAVQGNDLTVSGVPAGAVAAGTPVTLTVAFSKTMTVGESYFGELLLGPPTAPTALKVPIKITRN